MPEREIGPVRFESDVVRAGVATATCCDCGDGIRADHQGRWESVKHWALQHQCKNLG